MSGEFKARYGEWAVVTGASSGIGRHIALMLASRGLKVVLASRNEAALVRVADEIRAQSKVDSLVLPIDLGEPQAPARLLNETAPLPVGLLVNSAGFGTGGPFLASGREEAAAMVDLNCRALMELTYGFAERFVSRRRGGIILLSSIVAHQGTPFLANYAATKAYVHSLGEALAEELAPSGVDVLTAAPGPTESGFAARARMTLADAEPAERIARDIVAALGRKRVVVPGVKGKMLMAALSTAPRFLRVKIMKSVMASATGSA
jgi:short-subunit dehydrogenase